MFLDPVTMGICPEKNPFDHVSLSNEESRAVKKGLDDSDNKFDEARAAKLQCSTDDIQKKHDTIKDDMEVDTEANEPFEEYVKQVEQELLKLTTR